jgi:exonuclease SbcC
MTLEKGIHNLLSGIFAVKRMQADYAELQNASLTAEKIYSSTNGEYIKRENAFFREQAGILAESLEDGDPCPVCGSTVHPHKAKPTADAPSEAAIQKLKVQRDQKQQAMQAASDKAGRKRTEIDTMFIDEGFGALDAESLEQAIITLHGLTAGNRLVSIISHVAELKDRIDKKILIQKDIAGSTIKLVS